jgi:hypothetical protein
VNARSWFVLDSTGVRASGCLENGSENKRVSLGLR